MILGTIERLFRFASHLPNAETASVPRGLQVVPPGGVELHAEPLECKEVLSDLGQAGHQLSVSHARLE